MTDPTSRHGPASDAVVRLEVRDEHDLVRVMKQELPRLLDVPPQALVVDLSSLHRLSSGAVTALLWAGNACRRRGVSIRLQHLPRGGVRTLERTGLGAALPLRETEQ